MRFRDTDPVPALTSATAAAARPPPIPAWILSDKDNSEQAYIRVSKSAFSRTEAYRAASLSANLSGLHQQALVFQQLLPNSPNLTTWGLDILDNVQESLDLVTPLRAERGTARQEREALRVERDEYVAGEGRLHQRLGDADRIMNRLAAALTAAPSAGCASGRPQDEEIAGPDKFDGAREKLKEFKDQLVLKTSGCAVRFPNTQYKLRYADEILFDPLATCSKP